MQLYRRFAPGHFPNLTAVDLYCGGGGGSIGLAQAGFEILLGVDTDGYINEWNKKAAEVTGYSKGEMMGHLLVDAYAIKEEFKVRAPPRTRPSSYLQSLSLSDRSDL